MVSRVNNSWNTNISFSLTLPAMAEALIYASNSLLPKNSQQNSEGTAARNSTKTIDPNSTRLTTVAAAVLLRFPSLFWVKAFILLECWKWVTDVGVKSQSPFSTVGQVKGHPTPEVHVDSGKAFVVIASKSNFFLWSSLTPLIWLKNWFKKKKKKSCTQDIHLRLCFPGNGKEYCGKLMSKSVLVS